MTSKTSFFEKTVFWRDLRRMAPLWIVYLIFGLIALPVNLCQVYAAPYFGDLAANMSRHIVSVGSVVFTVGNFVYGAVAAWLSFFFLFSTRSTNFYAALPIRRESLFCTHYLSGLAVSIVPNLFLCAITVVTTAVLGSMQIGSTLCALAACTLSYLCFYSFAVLCCVVVGNAVAMPIIYIILNFAVPVIELIMRSLLSAFVYGMPTRANQFDVFSPLWKLMNSDFFNMYLMYEDKETFRFIEWSYLFVIAGAGLVIAVIAFLLYRRREMERSGDVVAVKWLRGVFQYAVTFGCSLVIGIFLVEIITNGQFDGNFAPVVISLLIGAFIGYFAARMLLKKTVRVFSSGWKQFAVCVGIIVVSLLLIRFDAFGYAQFVPDKEDVTSAEIATWGTRTEYPVEDAEAIEKTVLLHQRLIDERENISRIDDPDDFGAWNSFDVTYHLKNGKTVIRNYSFYQSETNKSDEDSIFHQLGSLLSTKSMVYACNTPGFDFSASDITSCGISGESKDIQQTGIGTYNDLSLSQQEAYRLYHECILPDLESSSLGTSFYYYQLHSDESWRIPVSNTYISLQIRKNGQNVYLTYRLTPDAENCIAYIGKHDFRIA